MPHDERVGVEAAAHELTKEHHVPAARIPERVCRCRLDRTVEHGREQFRDLGTRKRLELHAFAEVVLPECNDRVGYGLRATAVPQVPVLRPQRRAGGPALQTWCRARGRHPRRARVARRRFAARARGAARREGDRLRAPLRCRAEGGRTRREESRPPTGLRRSARQTRRRRAPSPRLRGGASSCRRQARRRRPPRHPRAACVRGRGAPRPDPRAATPKRPTPSPARTVPAGGCGPQPPLWCAPRLNASNSRRVARSDHALSAEQGGTDEGSALDPSDADLHRGRPPHLHAGHRGRRGHRRGCEGHRQDRRCCHRRAHPGRDEESEVRLEYRPIQVPVLRSSAVREAVESRRRQRGQDGAGRHRRLHQGGRAVERAPA